MKTETQEILAKLGLDPNKVLKKRIRGLPGITGAELVEALISSTSIMEAATLLGYSSNPVKQAIREYLLPKFIERSHEFGEGKKPGIMMWETTLLILIDKAKCSSCSTIFKMDSFPSDISKNTKISSYCRACRAGLDVLKKERVLLRVPKWSQLDKIQNFYSLCPTGYHVDHIIPLQGKYVSGLHVIENLQYLLAEDNRRKSNKYEI